jgi:hypothetical protein
LTQSLLFESQDLGEEFDNDDGTGKRGRNVFIVDDLDDFNLVGVP